MKVSVIVGRRGSVLATMLHAGEKAADLPEISFTVTKGQKLQEIELPPGLKEQLEDELHQTVKRKIKGSRPKTKHKAEKKSRKTR
jgi:hypothetical protein